MAEEIALELGVTFIGTEHILLALFRIKEGLGNHMLHVSGGREELARSAYQYWNDPTLKLREENAALQAKIEDLNKSRASFGE